MTNITKFEDLELRKGSGKFADDIFEGCSNSYNFSKDEIIKNEL